MKNFLYPDGLPIAMSLTAYNAFLTGLIVLLKRRDKAGVWYFVSNSFIFLWGVGLSFMLNNHLPAETSQSWGRVGNFFAVWIPATWLHFVLTYTGVKRFRFWLYGSYFVTVVISCFSLSNHFIESFQSIVGVNAYPYPGMAYTAFALLFFIDVLLSFIILGMSAIKEKVSSRKKDLAWVFFASLYGFFIGGLSFLPVYGVQLPQYNLLIMPLWQLMLTYAMIRFKAFDVETIVQAMHRDKLAAIGTLAASMNHEIRNPLYVIQGLAQSHLANLEEGRYPDKDKALQKSSEILQKTVQQSTRAMDIMKRFSMFAKQNVDEAANPEPVNLAEVVEEILPLVNHELSLDQILLKKQIFSDCVFKIDRRHLEEIIFNLIVNACQAIKHGERDAGQGVRGVIEISAQQIKQEIHLLIRDNGPGIGEEHLRQIFQPFYTTKEEGTGLGLYITKQLVERNGGKMTVQSQPGQGTEFTLVFPSKS